jgi:hypothetical protein
MIRHTLQFDLPQQSGEKAKRSYVPSATSQGKRTQPMTPEPKRPAPEPPEEAPQQGQGRSKIKEQRLKRMVKQHPGRDEPRVDSVEPDELPPP